MDTQEACDRFYWSHGDCCAGCDYWRHLNSVVGECIKSRLCPSRERLEVIGMSVVSLNIGAGHVLTLREYVCGNFKDEFDWSSLPLFYQKRIGVTNKITQ